VCFILLSVNSFPSLPSAHKPNFERAPGDPCAVLRQERGRHQEVKRNTPEAKAIAKQYQREYYQRRKKQRVEAPAKKQREKTPTTTTTTTSSSSSYSSSSSSFMVEVFGASWSTLFV
jgi:hypothetical protein